MTSGEDVFVTAEGADDGVGTEVDGGYEDNGGGQTSVPYRRE